MYEIGHDRLIAVLGKCIDPNRTVVRCGLVVQFERHYQEAVRKNKKNTSEALENPQCCL